MVESARYKIVDSVCPFGVQSAPMEHNGESNEAAVTLGAVIRTARHQLPRAIRSARRTAQRCGISVSYLSDIELDRRPCPSDEVLSAIAREVKLSKRMLFRLRDGEPLEVRILPRAS